MTAADLLVLVPWLIFAAGLTVIVWRLLIRAVMAALIRYLPAKLRSWKGSPGHVRFSAE